MRSFTPFVLPFVVSVAGWRSIAQAQPSWPTMSQPHDSAVAFHERDLCGPFPHRVEFLVVDPAPAEAASIATFPQRR